MHRSRSDMRVRAVKDQIEIYHAYQYIPFTLYAGFCVLLGMKEISSPIR